MNELLHEPDPRRTRWGLVALAVLAGIACSLQVGKVPSAIPTIRAELAIGLVAAGWVLSIFNFMGAGFGMVAGFVTDRLGHGRIVVVGLGFLALGSLLGGLATAREGLLAARLLEGVGFVVTAVAAPSIIATAAAPRHYRLALGLWSCYMPTGMAVMMLASPPLLAALGWRGLWFANAAVLAVFALVFALAVRGLGGTPTRRRTWADIRRTLARPGPWLLAGCFACYTVQWFGLMAWLPTFMVETMGRTATGAAVLSGLVVGVNIAGNLASGWLLHRGVPRWLLVAIVSASQGVLLFGIFSALVPAFARLAFALAFSMIGGILPAAILAGVPVHSRSPAEIGATNGVLVQGSNIGTLMGPPIVAMLVATFGDWGKAGSLLGLFGGLGIVLALALGAIERRL